MKKLRSANTMAKLQRETDVANVLSQMSQLVQHPYENETNARTADESGLIENLEHTYAQNAESESQETSTTINQTSKGRKNHTCEICGRAFSKLCNLKSHLRIHSGERPHACSLCSRAFANFWDLIRHNRTHSGEKPYKCHHCDRSFADFGSHKRHLRLHTKENPYKCHFCSKDFSRMDSYKSHLHTHSENKPYTCTSCDKKFAYHSTYKRHLSSHSGEKRFACDVCNKRFVRQDYLINHKRIHEKRINVDTTIESVININEGELLLCPSTEIESSSSYAASADLSPIPVLLSMAESAVVNSTICDTSEFLDSSALLAAASEIELGTSAECSTPHYEVSMDLEGCSSMQKSNYKNNAKISTVTSNTTSENENPIDSRSPVVLQNLNSEKCISVSDGFKTNEVSNDLQLYRQDISLLYRIGLQESETINNAAIDRNACNDNNVIEIKCPSTNSLTKNRTEQSMNCDLENNVEIVQKKSCHVNANFTEQFESQSFGSCISIQDTSSSYSFTF